MRGLRRIIGRRGTKINRIRKLIDEVYLGTEGLTIPEAPKFSGNKVCPICGCVRDLGQYCGHKECQVCRDRAIKRYLHMREILLEHGQGHLVPSEDVYVADMLKRMCSGDDMENPAYVVVDEIPDGAFK